MKAGYAGDDVPKAIFPSVSCCPVWVGAEHDSCSVKPREMQIAGDLAIVAPHTLSDQMGMVLAHSVRFRSKWGSLQASRTAWRWTGISQGRPNGSCTRGRME